MKLDRLVWFTLAALVLSGICTAQESSAPQGRTFVTYVSASNVVVAPGHAAPVHFTFHVQDPYHINSSHPMQEELIPTQLHFSLPGEVAVGKVQYPTGKLMSFPFDPSTKLSVYSGDVVISAVFIAPLKAATGTYTIHGELKYQACDNNSCYPPKKLPFSFNVKVGSSGRTKRRTRATATTLDIHDEKAAGISSSTLF